MFLLRALGTGMRNKNCNNIALKKEIFIFVSRNKLFSFLKIKKSIAFIEKYSAVFLKIVSWQTVSKATLLQAN